ncbi:MAG: HAD-IC family P-type ATPase [Candidatus Sungiibacteriota bacterium]|uniref:HAD-IC family P-type ATPase n=1 Tax=Candidatus Sungiibacteriota bacterium TaxID=2750080 RepID=A0A7T5RJQ1_9BACT|nr:MAG: HAD-IC family P-type ATPase [Candidatus Sungbacteria bacterium]
MALTRESTQQPFWAMSIEEVLRGLESSGEGLKEEEARRRQKIFGPNEIEERPHLVKLKIVLNQLKSPLILILIFAGVLTLVLREWVEAGVVFAAVLVNTALGFYQENKAEEAIAFLKTYIRVRARVRRSGGEREIDAAELVPGDVIRISQGDRVPADARLIFVNNLEVDESPLTGESLPVEKDINTLDAATALADRTPLVFSGTLATRGFADAVVTATASLSEFGKIAKFVAGSQRQPTPMQQAITRFAKRVGLLLGILAIILFGFGLWAGQDPFEMFLIAVAAAVSAVPEGLPIALTVILAVGVQRLASRKGVVRRLLAAETLGSTTLILTDKTGTLTQARMELAKVIPYQGSQPEHNILLLKEAILNTDTIIENPEAPPQEWRIFGRAVEVALVRGAAAQGVLLPEIQKAEKFLDRLPFSSEHKFSGVVARLDNTTRIVLLGAPEVLVSYTDMPPENRSSLLGEVDRLALGGERVLGVASAVVADHEQILHAKKFKHLNFRGLLTFRDPLRPEVSGAIKKIAASGVKTIIVTGDHRGTAEAVARDLGMVDGRGAVLTGDDLNFLSEEELRARSGEVTVYARVTPEQKVRLTNLYRSKGEVVALTGDGVNDAPALQAADIGIALGSGTDVAKGAADLVILDDNFNTIVAAIEEGRRIVENLRKVIVYLLSDSLDELFLIGGSLLVGLALPINALQILFVNFFSDSFPAIALAFEGGVDNSGQRPKKLGKSLFDGELQFLILVIGISTSALLFLFYYGLIKWGFSEDMVRTFIFASFATYTLILSFSLRSLEKSIFSYNPFGNKYLVGGVVLGILLTALVIFLPPLQKIFGTVPLSWPWLLAIAGVGLLNMAAVELGKWIFRSRPAS